MDTLLHSKGAEVTTPSGHAYRLLNIPHYATAQLNEYLAWAKSV